MFIGELTHGGAGRSRRTVNSWPHTLDGWRRDMGWTRPPDSASSSTGLCGSYTHDMSICSLEMVQVDIPVSVLSKLFLKRISRVVSCVQVEFPSIGLSVRNKN